MVKYNIVKAKIFLHSEKNSVIISEQHKLFKKGIDEDRQP